MNLMMMMMKMMTSRLSGYESINAVLVAGPNYISIDCTLDKVFLAMNDPDAKMTLNLTHL